MPKYSIPNDLFQHQKEDVERIIKENKNFLIRNEMGTGKTPTAISVAEMSNKKRVLIICPSHLIDEWKSQILDWTDLTAYSNTQNTYTRMNEIIYGLQQNAKYFVINYELLRNKECREIMEMIPFDMIVMDEVHKIRNIDSKVADSIWKFTDKHSKALILAMSGSPRMNYSTDLYMPLSIINPVSYPKTKIGQRHWSWNYVTYSSGMYGSYASGNYNDTRLERELAPFSIKRLKKDVLKFLPDKYYRRIHLDMNDDQRELYDQMEQFLFVLLDSGEKLTSPGVLATLIRLRQLNVDPNILGVACSSAKTEFLFDTVEESDGKIVVFSCFERYINYLSTQIFKDIPHICLTGKVPKDKFRENINKFQNDENVKLALCTIQGAGTGITLTASSTVIMIDRWWNEPTNQQAIDRLHRIGQKNAVQVLYPICNDSVDSVLDTIIQRKLGDGNDNENSITKAIVEERANKPRKAPVFNKIEDIKNIDVSADEIDLNFASSLEEIKFEELNKPEEKKEDEEILQLPSPTAPKVIIEPQEDEYEKMMKEMANEHN